MAGFISGNATLSAGSVSTAALADNAVTLAKMASGTDGNLIGIDASGDPAYIATGSDGQVLTSGGANVAALMEDAAGGGFTLATEQATTSGTSKTFSSIPSGVTMIVIMFEEVSFSAGVSGVDVHIGDSGGLETSSYIVSTGYWEENASTVTSSTSEFMIKYSGGAEVVSGNMILTLKDASNFTWIMSFTGKSATNYILGSGGSKSLSAELTQLSISGGTFDAGSINIMYQ